MLSVRQEDADTILYVSGVPERRIVGCRAIKLLRTIRGVRGAHYSAEEMAAYGFSRVDRGDAHGPGPAEVPA